MKSRNKANLIALGAERLVELLTTVLQLECDAVDPAILNYAAHPGHATFVDALRERHGRKQGFWSQVQQ